MRVRGYVVVIGINRYIYYHINKKNRIDQVDLFIVRTVSTKVRFFFVI